MQNQAINLQDLWENGFGVQRSTTFVSGTVKKRNLIKKQQHSFTQVKCAFYNYYTSPWKRPAVYVEAGISLPAGFPPSCVGEAEKQQREKAWERWDKERKMTENTEE